MGLLDLYPRCLSTVRHLPGGCTVRGMLASRVDEILGTRPDVGMTFENCCIPCGLFVTVTLRPMDSSINPPTTVATICPVCCDPLTHLT